MQNRRMTLTSMLQSRGQSAPQARWVVRSAPLARWVMRSAPLARWVVPPQARWVVWSAPLARWVVRSALLAHWVVPPQARWVVRSAPLVRWVVQMSPLVPGDRPTCNACGVPAVLPRGITWDVPSVLPRGDTCGVPAALHPPCSAGLVFSFLFGGRLIAVSGRGGTVMFWVMSGFCLCFSFLSLFVNRYQINRYLISAVTSLCYFRDELSTPLVCLTFSVTSGSDAVSVNLPSLLVFWFALLPCLYNHYLSCVM